MKKFNIYDVINIKKLLLLEPFDIAKVIKNLSLSEQLHILHLLPDLKIGLILHHLEPDNVYEILVAMEKTTVTKILNSLESDDLTTLLENLEPQASAELLSNLSGKKKEQVKYLLKYREDSAKAMMSLEFIQIESNLLIGDALKEIIAKVTENDYLDQIFVVEQQQFLGSVGIKQLFLAKATDDVASVTNRHSISVQENDSIATVIDKVSDYDLAIIPVLNEENQLRGIITADDILKEIKDNYQDLIQVVAQVDIDDINKPVVKRTLSRIPWLLMSVVLNLLIAGLIGQFEETISLVAALVLFQPMILGMSGNIGNQSLAVTILDLGNGLLAGKGKARKHLGKESLITVINALILGVVSFGFATIYIHFSQIGTQSALAVGYTVGLSMFIALSASGFCAVLLPLLFAKIKIDPIAASGPTLSTINDLISLLVYVGLASLLLL